MTMIAKLLTGGGPLTGDVRSAPLDCRWEELQNTRFMVSAATTGTPVGEFRVEVSDDPRVQDDIANGVASTSNETADWVTATIPAGAVHGLDGTSATFAGDAEAIEWDGTVAADFWISLENTAAFMRLAWIQESGGTGNNSLEVIGAT